MKLQEVISINKAQWRGKNSIHLQNEKAHDLETLGGIHKENATLIETSLNKE